MTSTRLPAYKELQIMLFLLDTLETTVLSPKTPGADITTLRFRVTEPVFIRVSRLMRSFQNNLRNGKRWFKLA